MKKTTLLFLILLTAAFSALAQQQTLAVAGLQEAVTVRRDARSIPYIEAKNEADLYFAQGYVTAADRLFQMDLLRRVARGETAEIFGRQGFEEDKRWRKLGFTGIVAESYQMLKPELKNAVDNYARGVNAYIATLTPDKLPVEYQILQFKPREWLPTDSMVIGKILADGLSNTWRQDLVQAAIMQLADRDKAELLLNQVTPYDVMIYGYDEDKTHQRQRRPVKEVPPSPSFDRPKPQISSRPPGMAAINRLLEISEQVEDTRRASLEKIGFYAEDNAASNNWVISGKRTADGKAILANDPHLPPTAPGIWYLTHLSLPTGRMSGVTFPGAPGIILGHNEYIAWGATNLGPDVQDLYEETFDPARPGMYKTEKGWKNSTIRKEEIKVRKNPLGPISDQNIEKLDVIETRHGVIYFEDGDKKYALRWTARDPKYTELGGFYYLNRAKDWKEFNDALKNYGGPAQNFVYADVKGNIGYHAAGPVPIRFEATGAVPYDGAKGEAEWIGTIPYDAEGPMLNGMPRRYTPDSGFLVTANQRVTGTRHEYFSELSRDAAMPWRARRISDMITAVLNSRRKITMDDCRDIQLDVFNIPLAMFAELVHDIDGASPETLGAMAAWNGRTTYDAKEPLIINEMRNVFSQKLADANLVDKDGKRLNISYGYVRERVIIPVLKGNKTKWLPNGFSSFKDLLLECEKQARLNLNALAARLKKDPAELVWGDYFTANFFHPLAGAPLIGGQFTVRPQGVNGSGQTPNVGASVSMRLIASPGNWDITRHVIPLGESGDPKSPYWKDQFESWRTGKAEIFWFSKEAVEKNAPVMMTLTPGK
jgi:penicillin amidase